MHRNTHAYVDTDVHMHRKYTMHTVCSMYPRTLANVSNAYKHMYVCMHVCVYIYTDGGDVIDAR
jgi:hypothetical protein